MTKDVFTDPEYAGLNWSIPRDTPDSERAAMHTLMANAALRARNRPRYADHWWDPATLQCRHCRITAADFYHEPNGVHCHD